MRKPSDLPILIIGGGISGLTLAIYLKKHGIPVEVFDKVDHIEAAGSGMSLIGHSLEILCRLGVDVRDPTTACALVQHDVSLRDWRGRRLLQVPTDADPELVAKFGSVQYNVHRGLLQQALMQAFGQRVHTGHRLASIAYEVDGARTVALGAAGSEEVSPFDRLSSWLSLGGGQVNSGASAVKAVVARFTDGQEARGRLVVGADGVRSAVRQAMFPHLAPNVNNVSSSSNSRTGLRPNSVRSVSRSSTAGGLHYSGFSCWRGLCDPVADVGPRVTMFKTVVHPVGGADLSFTMGWMGHVESESEGGKGRLNPAPPRTSTKQPPPKLRRKFWVLDVRHPADTSFESPAAAKQYVLDLVSKFNNPEIADSVRDTEPDAIVQTDVCDRAAITADFDGLGCVLIGDAAHPAVHHFGQGACMAIEDAVYLGHCLRSAWPSASSSDPRTPLLGACQSFDCFSRRFRTRLLVLMSRWSGYFYLNSSKFANQTLTVLLSWPFSLLFIFLVKSILFQSGYWLRKV